MKELAYLLKTDKETFDYMFDCIKATEEKILKEKGKIWKFKGYGADIIKARVKNKWLPILEAEENQLTIYDIKGYARRI